MTRLADHASSLASRALGVGGLMMMVLAALAPLTLVVTLTPLIVLVSGPTAPVLYLVAGATVLTFAVGWMAMSNSVRQAGAFFATVSHGLGRPAGAGAAFVAVLAFVGLQIATYGTFGVFVSAVIDAHLGVTVPWWTLALGLVITVMLIAHRGVLVSARVLGVALLLEIGALVTLAAAVLLAGGAEGLSVASSYNPIEAFSSGHGIGIILVIGAFAGFEAAVNFSEEARGGFSTVRRATIGSVVFIGTFYSFMTWIVVVGVGPTSVVAAAEADPVSLVTSLFDNYVGWLSPVMEALLILSMFAALLALHHATNRYLFALGRARVLPVALGRTDARTMAPVAAGRLQAGISFSVLAMWALLGLDPYLQLSLWGTALGVHEIVVWALASIAVFAYLRRNAPDVSLTQRVLAPWLSFAALVTIIVVVVRNISFLTEGSVVVNVVLLALGPAFFAAGAWRALYLRRTDPAAYESLLAIETEKS